MKTVFNISAVAVLLVALPGVCLALWDLDVVTKERAKELGMEIRSTAVRVIPKQKDSADMPLFTKLMESENATDGAKEWNSHSLPLQ